MSGTSRGSILLWDLEAGQIVWGDDWEMRPRSRSRRAQGSPYRESFDGPVLAIVCSSRWTCVAAASRNKRTCIRRYDRLTGAASEALETDTAAAVVSFDADGIRAISGTDTGELDLWDLRARTVRHLPGTTAIESASFSADGSKVVTTPLGVGPLVVYDFASGNVDRMIFLE